MKQRGLLQTLLSGRESDRLLAIALADTGARDVLATPTPGNASLRRAIARHGAAAGLRLRIPGDDETGVYEAIRLSFEQDVPGVVLLPPGATGLLALPALRVALRSRVPLLCILEAVRGTAAGPAQREILCPFVKEYITVGSKEQLGRSFAAVITALQQGGPVLLEWPGHRETLPATQD